MSSVRSAALAHVVDPEDHAALDHAAHGILSSADVR
jgi:hypothetical protein